MKPIPPRTLIFFAVISLVVYLLKGGDDLDSASKETIEYRGGEKSIATYRHNNTNLPPSATCTQPQKNAIFKQIGTKLMYESPCPVATWIDKFYEEEADIGSSSFLGISVGILKNAVNGLGLDFLIGKDFVVTHAAISSRDGTIKFPNSEAGTENLGLSSCDKGGGGGCVDVPMYSLESYVKRFVKSTGPVNILQIDVEGFDFDVLFGAGAVLDRTHYLEFEYHSVGTWGSLHLQDAVKLLDGKGFTCYWQGKGKLWRITSCYIDEWDRWHGWSNVACAHRTQTKLAARMEKLFLSTIE